MKKIFLSALSFLTLSLHTSAQVLFSSSFDNIPLQTYTTTVSLTKYAGIPSTFSAINDGFNNNVGDSTNPNRPFNAPGFKTAGWSTVYNAAENDTFLVSTSWLDTTGISVDRWVITPFIPNISANTVLTWRAKSPDPSFRDGYEVYGTNKTINLTNTDFTIGDRLLYIPDANASGQGEQSTWTPRSIDLSPFAGQNLRFAFRNNSKDMYQLWIDDIKAITLPHSTDAALQNIETNKYVLVNSSNTVKLNVTNAGSSDLSSFGISYMIGNSSVNTETASSTTTLSYGQSGELTFALTYSLSTPGLYTIKAWLNSVNGAADQNHANDTALYSVTVLNAAPSKTVLIEQFLSANDGRCTDAQAYAFALQSAPAIVVNIHDGDSLVEAGSATLRNDYKKDYATALIDRVAFPGQAEVTLKRADYAIWLNVEEYSPSPATISINSTSYTPATRQLSFTVKTGFLADAKGDYRLNAYLTENNVCGPYADTTVNGFNQLNGFYNIPWSEFYEQGYYSAPIGTYVIDALHFKHQNTLVHTFDGAYGQPGLIPSNGSTNGQSYEKTYTLTLPNTPANSHKFNPDNIYIVGFLSEYDADKTKRSVLNAAQQKLTTNPEFVGLAENAAEGALAVYPNPSANGLFHLSAKGSEAYQLKVFDLFGHCLKAESDRKAGLIDLSALPGGMYLLELRSDRGVSTKKVIIQKN